MCCQPPRRSHLLADIETLIDTFAAPEIARRAGTDSRTLRLVLDGTIWPGPNLLRRIAEAFGLTIGELVDVLAPRYFATGKTDAYWFVLNWRHRLWEWQRSKRLEKGRLRDEMRPKTKLWRIKLREKAAAAAPTMALPLPKNRKIRGSIPSPFRFDR